MGDTEFVLSAIPVGGYLEIAGSYEVGQGEQLHAQRTDDRTLASKSLWKQLFVILGGIISNALFAYLAFTILLWQGMPPTNLFFPQNATSTIKTLGAGSVAEQAGINPGDILVSINNRDVRTDIPAYVSTLSSLTNPEVALVLERQATKLEKTIILPTMADGTLQKTLGIQFVLQELPALPLGESLIKSWHANVYITQMTLSSLKHMIVDHSTDQVGGPLRIVADMSHGAQKGWKFFLLFLGFVSLSLAVFNILPFPVLDGGQAVILILESLIGRKLPETTKTYLYYACWVLLLGLIAYLSVKDIMQFVRYIAGLLFPA